jgi:putative ABC transport system permease protein
MAALLTDIQLAIRTLRKSPGFTAAAVLTLGLAMTLCTMVMAVLNAYLFRDLPYPGAERLYSVRYSAPGQDEPDQMETLDWAALGDAIEQPIAWDLDMFYVLGGETAERAPGAWVTPGFVEGLGIRPEIGRGFDAAAFAAGSGNVALISHRLWTSRFNRDQSVVGQTFTAYVSDRPEEAERFTIIGVLPERFWHVNEYTDILVPLRAPTYPYMVRLRAGVTADEAASRITALVRAGASGVPPKWQATLTSTRALYVERIRPILRSVTVASALVLLVGCANVAGLLLLRATRRQREIAVRTALGASRAAIARMLAAEALVVGAAATACALFLTRLTLSSLAPLVQRQLGRSAPGGEVAFALDTTVLVAAALVGLATALLCGLTPILASFRPGVAAALQSSTRTTTEGRRSRRLRAGLIALEIAASLALLSGSALMLRTVVSLVRADLGFESERTLIASITLRQNRYPDAASRLAFYDRLLRSIGGIAGIRSVALTSSWPLLQQRVAPIETEGPTGRASTTAAIHAVTADYFATTAIPIASGRAFAPFDREGSEPAAIVSDTLAKRLWPGESAVGHRLLVPFRTQQGPSAPVARLVVGVARDVRQDPADVDLADVYLPMPQAVERFAVALVRTEGSPQNWLPALRGTFHDVDAEIPMNARPLQRVIEDTRSRPEFLASLLAVLAAIAAFVAVVGVYGMMAYAVRQREREIAVRIAIGADPRHVTEVFLREGATVLAAGLALGVFASLAAGRLLESQLFGVKSDDPVAVLAAAGAFGTAGLLAVWWPSRRAAETDPAIALRTE